MQSGQLLIDMDPEPAFAAATSKEFRPFAGTYVDLRRECEAHNNGFCAGRTALLCDEDAPPREWLYAVRY